MTNIYDETGKFIPVTVIKAGPCVVTQVRTVEKDGYSAIQLGFDEKKVKNTTKALQGHFAKANTTPKKLVREFSRFEEGHRKQLGETITVDEATATLDEMRQLAAVYQHFVTEGRKVALVIAGLPYHVNQLISDESVSFLRRATQVVLQRISDADIAYAFVHTLESAGKDAQEPAVSACVRAIDGFPYMLQLVGYRVWLESGSARTVTEELAQRGIQAATVDLQEQILAATYRNLSPGDVRFLEAMAQDEQESRISEIAQRMDVGNNYAANYKKRLLAQGVIDEPARSIVRFSIPGMREYVLARKAD